MREPTWPEIRKWAEEMLTKTQKDLEEAVGEQSVGRHQGRCQVYRLVLNLPSILETREVLRQQIAAKTNAK